MDVKDIISIFAKTKTNIMKFKDLTEEDKKFISDVYKDKDNEPWEKRAAKLGEKYGVSERTMRRWCSEGLGLKERVDVEPVQFEKAKQKVFNKEKKRFIITWAQNNTPIHDNFFNNIKSYAEFIDADIHVIAGRYKNPTSVFTDEEEDFWVPEVEPYLDANRHDIHKYFSIMSDIKIQPTATNPMSGLQGLSGNKSCVFGSPKVQLEVSPALEGHKPKIMITTGAATVKNYTDSKSGKKGEFHHTLGFVIVEIKNDKKFFFRQVTALENGNFTDLFYVVENGSVNKIDRVEAIIWGDLHLGDHDEEVVVSTLDFMKKIKPKEVVIHDIFNGHSISHHDEKNPFKQYENEKTNRNSLIKEINFMLDWINENLIGYNVTIVRSNHDDFVDRWLINSDWKKVIKNALEYIRFSGILLEGKAPNGIIPYLIQERFPKIKTLGRDHSFKIKNWELGVHGDYGTNGSRGSLEQFRKLNTKVIVGHYHTPGRKDGALAVGTSTKLRVGYNMGPSSWLHSHVIIHADGKAQHITMIDGEYTTFEF